MMGDVEKCECDRLSIEWDRDERRYAPYCLEYDVWLNWTEQTSIDDFLIDEDKAFRSKICFLHGKPIEKVTDE